MKRILFCYMALALTFVVASARDVGSRLHTDIGITYTVPTVQQPVFSADYLFAAIATQPTAVVQVRAVALPVTNLMKYQLYVHQLIRQPDYGNYRLINKGLQIQKNTQPENTKGNTQPIETTARHVL